MYKKDEDHCEEICVKALRTVPPNTRPFCAEYNYAGKADHSTGR